MSASSESREGAGVLTAGVVMGSTAGVGFERAAPKPFAGAGAPFWGAVPFCSATPFCFAGAGVVSCVAGADAPRANPPNPRRPRSEEHTSELQSRGHLVCRLL